ncbi:MAG: CDP-alcohol phosphatidyltransferase family protein, partial [Treponemataceae bacterium]|nr:CDP-alcohol phosphatidyltransferase family protein [Treponemataceae bacterium]
MLGVYDYTVVLTYVGTIFAFLGIGYAVDGKGHLFTALVCLMVSGFCDMFDGKIASTKKNRTIKEKKFGVQIDSLSDLVCFGVLPAVFVYQMRIGSKRECAVAAFYLLCGLIRLAYFNVEEEERSS